MSKTLGTVGFKAYRTSSMDPETLKEALETAIPPDVHISLRDMAEKACLTYEERTLVSFDSHNAAAGFGLYLVPRAETARNIPVYVITDKKTGEMLISETTSLHLTYKMCPYLNDTYAEFYVGVVKEGLVFSAKEGELQENVDHFLKEKLGVPDSIKIDLAKSARELLTKELLVPEWCTFRKPEGSDLWFKRVDTLTYSGRTLLAAIGNYLDKLDAFVQQLSDGETPCLPIPPWILGAIADKSDSLDTERWLAISVPMTYKEALEKAQEYAKKLRGVSLP